jgi:hypothetical protein
MARKKSSTALQGGFLVLFGLAFLAPGLLMSWLYFAGFAKWWAARQWVEVPCWIESAELRVSHDDSTTYQATASYRYIYQDRAYHGNRVGLSGGSDNIGSFQQRVHRELMQHTGPRQQSAERDPSRIGTKPFRCYVNPARPEDAMLYRELRWEMQAFMAIFALTFPAVGAGVMLGGWSSMRQQRAARLLAASHPDAPWRWRPEWTSGPIPETNGPARIALAAYTGWAGLIVTTLLGGAWLSGAFHRDHTPWLLLIFPALWCIPAWFCGKRLRHRLAVGTVRFEMAPLPASPGGVLSGAILLEKPAQPVGGGAIELLCERKTTTRSGGESSTSTTTVWTQQEPLAPERVSRDVAGCRIPVRFAIPVDAPPCTGSGGDDDGEISWVLKLKIPSASVHAAFSLPVFQDPNSHLQVPSDTTAPLSIRSAAAANLPLLLERAGIAADLDGRGLPQRLHCPAARNRGLLVFLLVFVLAWTGFAGFLLQSAAPLLFKIVWPASAAGLWLAVIWQTLFRRTVTFDSAGLRVHNQLGPIQWRTALDRSQLTGFSFDSNLRSNNQAFYRVRVTSVIGKHHTLVHGLTDSAAAEALVERLETWRKSG